MEFFTVAFAILLKSPWESAGVLIEQSGGHRRSKLTELAQHSMSHKVVHAGYTVSPRPQYQHPYYPHGISRMDRPKQLRNAKTCEVGLEILHSAVRSSSWHVSCLVFEGVLSAATSAGKYLSASPLATSPIKKIADTPQSLLILARRGRDGAPLSARSLPSLRAAPPVRLY